MSDWPECQLGDLVHKAGGQIQTGPFGSQLHAHEYIDDPNGVPVVMPRDMSNGRVDRSSVKRINEETASRLKAHRLSEGDLVLARRGDIGRLASIAAGEEGWVCGTGSMRIHAPNHDVLDPGFLRYAMSAPSVGEWLVGQAVGATMPNLNAEIVLAVPLRVPAIKTQRRVAAACSAFDRLIAINERRIELLEDLARSLYRDRFVHFRVEKHGEMKLVDSALGPIPADWDVKGLYEVANIGFGFPFKSSGFTDSGRNPVVRIRDVPVGMTNTFTDEEPDLRYRVADGDILIGMDGNFHVRQWSGGEAWLNQRVARLRPRGELGAKHLMLAVVDPIRHLNSSIVGTTVAHLGKRHLEEIRLVMPPARLLATVGGRLDALGDLQLSCEKQIRSLSVVRDLLLPRLVTGELDISDIDLGVLTPAESD